MQGQKVFEQSAAQPSFYRLQCSDGFGQRVVHAVRGGEVSGQFGGHPVLFALLQFEQDVFLGREVEEESAVRDAGSGDDRRGIRPPGYPPRALELGERGAEQSLAGLQTFCFSMKLTLLRKFFPLSILPDTVHMNMTR